MSDNRFFDGGHPASGFSNAKLAFVGDAVYELMAREYLTDCRHLSFEKVTELKKELVCAQTQARAAERLLPLFDEEEKALFRHGRNAEHRSIPKNATAAQYGMASGLETVFGYLWLAGRKERLAELFGIIAEEEAKEIEG